MTIDYVADRVVLTVAADQASHGDRFVLQSQDGTIYFRSPGKLAIDKLTADECALRWNAHKALCAALERTERWITTGCGPRPLDEVRAALALARGEA